MMIIPDDQKYNYAGIPTDICYLIIQFHQVSIKFRLDKLIAFESNIEWTFHVSFLLKLI